MDWVFEFEEQFIRGLEKMKPQMGLALVVMLAMPLGQVKGKETDKLRSLVQAV